MDENLDIELRRKLLTFAERYDLETGLLAYRAFQDSTNALLQKSAEAGHEVALVWIDLLNLRREFALSGWTGAEAMVEHVARTLREVAGPDALLGRFNGRCFMMAMTLPDCKRGGKQHLQSINETLLPLRAKRPSIALELAVGVAFHPVDTASAEELLRFACLAATHAGLGKHSSVVSFHSSMNNLLIRDHEMEVELYGALERGDLYIAYQPKVDLISGCVLGAEALMRWNHPDWGSIPPAHFIPIAERSEIIQRIFELALRTALEDARQWCAQGFSIPLISVNASVANLRQEDFSLIVGRLMAEIPIAPTELEIEVTESLLFEDEDLFTQRLEELKAIGVRIAIDDFGTRYTGFDALHRLPLDAMKIDKCFVQGIDRSPDMRALCQTIVAMARQLKMRTVAEGIELPEELEALQQIGCDAGQGYLFQHALPAQQFIAFLREWPERSHDFGFVTHSELRQIEPLLEG